MENFKIISTLKAYAESLDIAFLAGSDYYQNYEASEIAYTPGQLVLGADFRATPIYSTYGAISEIRYRGVLALGRKFETSATGAELDETFIQKTIRRLEELMQLLSFHSRAFACENNLIIASADYEYKLNEFDSNIDFVTCNITFVQ